MISEAKDRQQPIGITFFSPGERSRIVTDPENPGYQYFESRKIRISSLYLGYVVCLQGDFEVDDKPAIGLRNNKLVYGSVRQFEEDEGLFRLDLVIEPTVKTPLTCTIALVGGEVVEGEMEPNEDPCASLEDSFSVVGLWKEHGSEGLLFYVPADPTELSELAFSFRARLDIPTTP